MQGILPLFLLFFLLQVLQFLYLKVLAFSTTFFHLTESWMHFVQLFIFVEVEDTRMSVIKLGLYVSLNALRI
jgi:hypothetical protein